MRGVILTVVSLGLSLTLLACGGGAPEPKEPAAAAEPGPGGPAEEPEGDAPADSEKDGASKEASSPAASTETKSVRSPKDRVTRSDVLFVFSFPDSEAHAVAEKKCGEKAGDDPKKKADCMSKASGAIDADSITFEEDSDQSWWWLTVRRKGDKLVTLHKIQVTFGAETEKSITIVPKGADKGSQPMGRIPKELVIEVPSDSEIALTDPKHGRMVYQAKLGLKGDQKR